MHAWLNVVLYSATTLFYFLSLITGQPGEFHIMISPDESSAVDMYLLMDLTLTMQEDLGSIRQFAGDLGK